MKKYTTEQVWGLLKKHPKRVFKILGDDGGDNEFIQYVAYVDNYGPVIEIKTKSINCDNFNIYKIFRSDNKIGNVVSSDWVWSNKSKPIRLGKLSGANQIGLWVIGLHSEGNLVNLPGEGVDSSKTYKVVLIECD